MTDLPARDPGVTPETEAFWEATREGRLLLSECPECGDVIWYPRARCPGCLDVETEWIEASGEGAIYSYSVVHQASGPFADATPYVLAYVELEEGPRVLSNVVEADPDELSVGQAVEVVFDETEEGYAIPRFRPV